jgi:hypothetical protein
VHTCRYYRLSEKQFPIIAVINILVNHVGIGVPGNFRRAHALLEHRQELFAHLPPGFFIHFEDCVPVKLVKVWCVDIYTDIKYLPVFNHAISHHSAVRDVFHSYTQEVSRTAKQACYYGFNVFVTFFTPKVI